MKRTTRNFLNSLVILGGSALGFYFVISLWPGEEWTTIREALAVVFLVAIPVGIYLVVGTGADLGE